MKPNTRVSERNKSVPLKDRHKDTKGKGHQPESEIPRNRWLYLIGVAERLSEISLNSCSDYYVVHDGIVKNLISLNEVFSRDIDPISDLEGYAVRRLSQTIIKLLENPTKINR